MSHWTEIRTSGRYDDEARRARYVYEKEETD